jgi:hypothetical protein
MKLWPRLFEGSMSGGASIDPSNAWTVAPPDDPRNLAAALRVLLNETAAVALESNAFDAEVADELRPFTVDAPLKIRPGTLWPTSGWLHVRATDTALLRLGELTRTLPAPQVCSHLYAYDGDRLLLCWQDFSDGRILLRGDTPEVLVSRFSAELGGSLIERPT